MAVTFKNSGKINAKTFNIPFIGARVTMSAYVRLNSLPTSGMQTLFVRGQCRFTAIGPAGGSTYTFNAQCMSAAGTTRTHSRAGAAVGGVYHLALVYDKDDASRRFVAVNGAKVPWAADLSGPLGTISWLGYGGSDSDFTIQRAFFLDGYAATDADVSALAGDADAAPAVFAAAAATPGVLAMYHSLEGAVGADVRANEPGVSWGGDPNYGIPEPTRATSGDVVRYSEPMACKGALAVERAYVGSAGKTVTVILTDGEGRARVAPQGDATAAAPSIRIDGGPPIALPTTASAGAYVQPTADALFFPMPAGVSVSPGQAVLLDAPAGWISPQIGFAPAIFGLAVDNFAGMPISDGLWPGAPPARVGTNAAITSATEYTPVVMNRNRALNFRMGMNAKYWPDGTFKGPIVNAILAQSGGYNRVDPEGIAGKEGLWAIGWSDYDHANPVTMVVGGDGVGSVVKEVRDYRNDGDAEGRGKVRVYDVRFGATTAYTLREAVDATATTIRLVEPIVGSLNESYLVVDGEQILVGSYDAVARTCAGCTRGWNGTVAAAHAAGAAITARRRARYGNLYVTMTCPDAPNLHYADFVAYQPGSWPEPTKPGPVTLPPRDDLALDEAMEGFLSPGCGGFRHMDGTPAQGFDVAEPEQMAKPGAPHYANPGYVDRLHFASVGPFDPAASPYFYTPTPWPASETYTATLAAAIATAPPPGTVETIAIADGRRMPVMLGQLLFDGGEIMRVVGVPREGDEYRVERGSRNTPTATHAAGPIVVGYRIPITQASQYIPVDPATHRYEAVFDQDLSTPLTFGRNLANGGYSDWGGTDDANIAARRTLTLTAPLAATALDVYATPAAESDWDFIATNINLAIGSEVLVVAAVDRAAGKITVKSRPAGAAAYPAGATARTRSSGVLLQGPDGTKRGYNRLYNAKNAILPTAIDRALVFVGDDGLGLGGSGTPAVLQPFDAPDAGTKEFVSPYAVFPYAETARQTATAPLAWHWLCVPGRSTDAAVYEAARQVRDHLPAGRKVIFELGNEIWNWRFPNTQVYEIVSHAVGLANHRELYILRSRAAFEVARACFAEVGRQGELVHVVCSQTGVDILADCRRLGVEPDAAAIAPYIITPKTAACGAAFTAVDDDQACDLYTFLTYYDGSILQYRQMMASMDRMLASHEAATGRRPLKFCYEGGLEAIVLPGTPGFSDPLGRRRRDIPYNPNFYFTERDYYGAMRSIGGVDLYMQYEIASTSPYTDYDDSLYLWGLLRGPAQKAGYGDGRDGGVDNRRYRYAAPEDLTKTGDVYCESVRMQAWLDHQRRWVAAQAGNQPDPEPGTGTPAISFAKPGRLVISRFRPRFG
ncbi:MAG: hypothetical protein BGO49_17460 [Planctomycetales bacterium 71-10]|nr:MAG: hypothetical protein BGO49_17460 [Planctomycetales bacterium 71-10]